MDRYYVVCGHSFFCMAKGWVGLFGNPTSIPEAAIEILLDEHPYAWFLKRNASAQEGGGR